MNNELSNLITMANNVIFQARYFLTSNNTNLDLPLSERWTTFEEAPSYLKNHEAWVLRFTFPDGTEFEADSEYIERHQVKNMIDVVDSYKDAEFEKQLGNDSDWEEARAAYPDSENVIAFKEYILKNNIGSFTMDW